MSRLSFLQATRGRPDIEIAALTEGNRDALVDDLAAKLQITR